MTTQFIILIVAQFFTAIINLMHTIIALPPASQWFSTELSQIPLNLFRTELPIKAQTIRIKLPHDCNCNQHPLPLTYYAQPLTSFYSTGE